MENEVSGKERTILKGSPEITRKKLTITDDLNKVLDLQMFLKLVYLNK